SRLDCVVLFLWPGSFAPRLESDKEKRVVGVVHDAQQTKTDDAGGVLHAGCLAEEILDLSTNLIGALQRSRIGQLKCHVDISLVFLRQKRARQSRSEKTRADRKHGEQRETERSFSNRQPGPIYVAMRRAAENLIEPTVKQTERDSRFLSWPQQ